MWLIQNCEEVKTAIKEKRCMMGTVDSWLLYNMTGEHLTGNQKINIQKKILIKNKK